MGDNKIADDPRIDPRIKALMGFLDRPAPSDVASREELLEEARSEEALALRSLVTAFLGMCDTEEVAPSAGLTITEHVVVSAPDANKINIRFIRPDGDDELPCVYYIHGGGMANMSCYDATTGPGAGSSPPRVWPSPWSTSAIPSSLRPQRRWPRIPPA